MWRNALYAITCDLHVHVFHACVVPSTFWFNDFCSCVVIIRDNRLFYLPVRNCLYSGVQMHLSIAQIPFIKRYNLELKGWSKCVRRSMCKVWNYLRHGLGGKHWRIRRTTLQHRHVGGTYTVWIIITIHITFARMWISNHHEDYLLLQYDPFVKVERFSGEEKIFSGLCIELLESLAATFNFKWVLKPHLSSASVEHLVYSMSFIVCYMQFHIVWSPWWEIRNSGKRQLERNDRWSVQEGVARTTTVDSCTAEYIMHQLFFRLHTWQSEGSRWVRSEMKWSTLRRTSGRSRLLSWLEGLQLPWKLCKNIETFSKRVHVYQVKFVY